MRNNIDLKLFFSWPAYLNIFFYILKNRDKKWKKLEREKNDPDVCYKWTFNFLKILWLVEDYDKELNKIILTNKWEELYYFVKYIDDYLLFEHKEVREWDIKKYENELIKNIWIEKVGKIKNILYWLILKTKWYDTIKKIIDELWEIDKNTLYIKLSEELNVALETIKNRVPSMLQLAMFLNLLNLSNWKYTKRKEISKIQELSIDEHNLDDLLKNLKEYIKQDIFFNDIKIWSVNSNKYFQLWLKWNNKISNNWIHFEVIRRKNQLFLEIHFENKENNNFKNRIKFDENKYEWFDWFESKSIRNKKIFELNKSNFEEIKNILIEMYKDFNNELNTLTSKLDKMIENLTSQESLLLLSLLTKPFSILYWVSWTWKSRVVKELWKKMYWEDYKKYFHKEAVPPNWFDETEVLWRYNEIEKYKEWSFIKHLEKAIKDQEHNYVYLLDEMNLSHIEQYFAQYLSAIEELNSDNAWIHVWEKEIEVEKNEMNL